MLQRLVFAVCLVASLVQSVEEVSAEEQLPERLYWPAVSSQITLGSSLFHVDLVGASCRVKWLRIFPSGAPSR